MDTIRFEIGERDDPSDGIVDAVAIFVNGLDLVDILREVELPFATREGKPDLAGSYGGLAARGSLPAIASPVRRA